MKFYENWIIKILKSGDIPNHIAFIMDGNRRHAKNLGLEKSKGHSKGFESLKRCLEWCFNLGVKIVTVYAFAIDNFKRDKEEVDYLMRLAKEKLLEISQKTEFLERNSIKVKVCGNLGLLDREVHDAMLEVMRLTQNNDKLLLNICFAYDSIFEIENAMKLVCSSQEEPDKSGINEERLNNISKSSNIENNSINKVPSSKVEDLGKESKINTMNLKTIKEKFESNLLVKDKADLIVRTSNEIRLSNFMVYQGITSQLCFIKENWPELSIWSFFKIVLDYQRHRKANTDFESKLQEYNDQLLA